MKNSYTRSRREGITPSTGGPYEAIVVNHLDPTYMGTLEVELLRHDSTGNNPERTGQVVTVRYLSPFYGVNPELWTTPNDGYEFSQHSYGFWMIPPDPGTKVLVIFAEDNSAYGYWMGCIQDNYMNFQIPDQRASTTFTTDITPGPLKGKKLPTGEYNKKVETGESKDPTKFRKPYNKDFTQVLESQGLLDDEIRGTTTTSARREVPSMVFGFSSPGPLDKRPGAPRYPYGNQKSKANNQFFSRLGGSSFVFDDGDDKYVRKTHAEDGPPIYRRVEAGEKDGDATIPHNELIRLRTRTGHQILMHNSEDLIYIGNSRGTAWIEMTSDGKIDIHADDSISIMTGADLNITAERDINMEAGRNINMKATARYSGGDQFDINNNESGRIQAESVWNTNIDVGNDYKLTVHNNSDTVVDKVKKVLVKDNYHFHTNKNRYQRSDETTHEESGFSWYRESESNINDLAAGLVMIDAGGGGGPDIHLNSNLATPATSPEDAEEVVHLPTIGLPYIKPGTTTPQTYQSILCRAPQHEPWPQHENMNPLSFKTKETDREAPGAITNTPFAPLTPDTFAKGTGSASGPVAGPQSQASVNSPISGAPAIVSNLGDLGSAAQELASIGVPDAISGLSDTVQSVTSSIEGSIGQVQGAFSELASLPNQLASGLSLPNNLEGIVNGFSNTETAAFLNNLGSVTNNAYNFVNELGEVGRYAMNVSNLQLSGLIDTASSLTNSSMLDPSNWTGRLGINSAADFIQNVQAQEIAVLDVANRNIESLRNIGGILDNDSNAQISGMLTAAHRLGADAASNFRRNADSIDRITSNARDLFNSGHSAITRLTA